MTIDICLFLFKSLLQRFHTQHDFLCVFLHNMPHICYEYNVLREAFRSCCCPKHSFFIPKGSFSFSVVSFGFFPMTFFDVILQHTASPYLTLYLTLSYPLISSHPPSAPYLPLPHPISLYLTLFPSTSPYLPLPHPISLYLTLSYPLISPHPPSAPYLSLSLSHSNQLFSTYCYHLLHTQAVPCFSWGTDPSDPYPDPWTNKSSQLPLCCTLFSPLLGTVCYT